MSFNSLKRLLQLGPAILFGAVPLVGFAQSGHLPVQDDFSTYTSGSAAESTWKIGDGFWYAADGLFCEAEGEHHAGAFLPAYLDHPYEATVRFKMEGGERGAGFFFNSASTENSDYTHLARIEGDQIILGYLEGSVYYSLGDARLPESAKDGGWHSMSVRVRPVEGMFSFSLDGETVRGDVPLRYRTGYLGLQNSGAAACFDDFAVEALPGGDEGLSVSWPMAAAPTDDGVWVASPVSGTVRKISPGGTVLARLNASGDGRPFVAPSAVVTLADGGIIVLDGGAARLHRFDAEGNWMATGGSRLREPFDVAAWADGSLAVTDAASGEVVLFNADLERTGDVQRTGDVGHSGDVEPGVVAAAPGLLAFVDRDAGYVHVLRESGEEWQPAASFALPPGAARGLALTGDALFVTVDDLVLRYDHEGTLTRSLPLGMMGRVFPQRLAVRGDDLYIADYFGDRIIITGTDLTSPQLSHEFTEGGDLHVSWRSGTAAPMRIEIRTNDALGTEQTGSRASTQHTFTVEDVRPATLYRVRYAPLLRTIPESTELSSEVVLMSPPPNGKTPYVNVKSAVILFANVVDEEKAEDWPEQPPLPAEEVDRILEQIRNGGRYYWMNSGMRLHLDMDFFVVERPLSRSEVFEGHSYYPPVDGMADGILEEQGADIEDYESIYYLVVSRDYDTESETWDIRGPGGAFTNGLGWNGEYGRSWWEVTRAGHPAGNNWLVVHEFHHQLDELFMLSGYPEYWFNHFSPHIGTSADFGEHFDGNAYILRQWPGDRYFDLDYGELRFADDDDGDGIPDDAPDLPMDEKRLSSSPDRADTDGDGLTDREELAFSNWIVMGWGETYAEPAFLPDLTNADTDGDGLADPADAYPLLPFTPEIAPLASGFAPILSTEDARAPYEVHAAWTPDSLFLRFDLPEPRRVRILLDANADGWFSGRDNVEFRLGTDETMDVDINVLHAGRPDVWPSGSDALKQSLDYSWRRVTGGAYQLAVARNPRLGIELTTGEQIGLNVGVALPSFADGRERYLTVHEPNRSIDFTLTSGSGAVGSTH